MTECKRKHESSDTRTTKAKVQAARLPGPTFSSISHGVVLSYKSL